MKTLSVDVAIVGAGSGGLSAYSMVKRKTDRFVVINEGLHGTTCARVGCMPSKVLIQVANDYYRRKVFASEGILGAEALSVDQAEVMKFVRKLRDRFVRGVMHTVDEIGERNISGRAEFLEPNVLKVNDQRIEAKKIILATGSTPIIPDSLANHQNEVLTSDSIFEQERFSKKIAVLGTGVIGLELGQALSRLGIEVKLLGRSKRLSGLQDPKINDYAIIALSKELDITFSENWSVERLKDGRYRFLDEKKFEVDQVLCAIGRRPNVYGIGLEKLGIALDQDGIPKFNSETMQLEGLPIFIAGDVTNELPILHEASDEGKIAGLNAVSDSVEAFKRRTPLQITFCDPNIAIVGKRFKDLSGTPFETGEVTFEGQGRSIVKSKEMGLLHVYGEKRTGKLLGAEIMGPDAEHLAHLLSWVIQRELSCFEVLRLPFYHPVVEEGLRTAIRDLAKKIDPVKASFEMDPV